MKSQSKTFISAFEFRVGTAFGLVVSNSRFGWRLQNADAYSRENRKSIALKGYVRQTAKSISFLSVQALKIFYKNRHYFLMLRSLQNPKVFVQKNPYACMNPNIAHSDFLEFFSLFGTERICMYFTWNVPCHNFLWLFSIHGLHIQFIRLSDFYEF